MPDPASYDPSSWGDLRTRFLAVLSAGPPARVGLWLDVWRVFVGHPRYRAVVEAAARRLLARRHAPPEWREDVEHDAMLLLARTLRRAPDLHVDQARVEERFPGWVGTIVARDCLQALRRLRTLSGRTSPLGRRDPADPRAARLDARRDARIDLSLALDRLPEPDRGVLTLYAKGHTVREAADALGLSYARAYGALRRGRERLNLGP